MGFWGFGIKMVIMKLSSSGSHRGLIELPLVLLLLLLFSVVTCLAKWLRLLLLLPSKVLNDLSRTV